MSAVPPGAFESTMPLFWNVPAPVMLFAGKVNVRVAALVKVEPAPIASAPAPASVIVPSLITLPPLAMLSGPPIVVVPRLVRIAPAPRPPSLPRPSRRAGMRRES